METTNAHCGSPISQLCITSSHRNPSILGCTVSNSGSRAHLRHQLIVAAHPKVLRTIGRAGEYLLDARRSLWNAMRCFARGSMQQTARWHATGPMGMRLVAALHVSRPSRWVGVLGLAACRSTGGASSRRDTCLIGEGRSARLVDRAEVWHPTDLWYVCCQRCGLDVECYSVRNRGAAIVGV